MCDVNFTLIFVIWNKRRRACNTRSTEKLYPELPDSFLMYKKYIKILQQKKSGIYSKISDSRNQCPYSPSILLQSNLTNCPALWALTLAKYPGTHWARYSCSNELSKCNCKEFLGHLFWDQMLRGNLYWEAVCNYDLYLQEGLKVSSYRPKKILGDMSIF